MHFHIYIFIDLLTYSFINFINLLIYLLNSVSDMSIYLHGHLDIHIYIYIHNLFIYTRCCGASARAAQLVPSLPLNLPSIVVAC